MAAIFRQPVQYFCKGSVIIGGVKSYRAKCFLNELPVSRYLPCNGAFDHVRILGAFSFPRTNPPILTSEVISSCSSR